MQWLRGPFIAGVAITLTYFATLLLLHRQIAIKSSISLRRMQPGLSVHDYKEPSSVIRKRDTKERLKSIKSIQPGPSLKNNLEAPVLKERTNVKESSKSLKRTTLSPPKPKRKVLKEKQIGKVSSKALKRTSSIPKRNSKDASAINKKHNKKGILKSLNKTRTNLPKKQKMSALNKKESFQNKQLRLEPLNKTNHFRGEISPNYFLGAQIDFNKYGRRVLLDIGASTFGSSVKWFLNNYPGRFTDIHAFEMKPDVFIPPPPGSDVLRGAMLTTHEIQVDVVNTEEGVDIVDFILNEAKLKEDDIVVVKMGVNGDEWKLLERMEKGQVFHLIDEMMVDIHYNHPRMPRYGWQVFNHTLAEAYNLFKHLREDLGVFVHPWP